MEKPLTLLKVPPVDHDNPHRIAFIDCVVRLMAFLDDRISVDWLLGLSGIGLCFPWKYKASYDDIAIISEIPSRMFSALGYESVYLVDEALQDRKQCFELVQKAIDRGVPVIGMGVAEQCPAACLVVGYSEEGLFVETPVKDANRVLEPQLQTQWHENCTGLLIVGLKTGERLTGRGAYGRIVEWARFFRNTECKLYGKDEVPINRGAFPALARWFSESVWETEVDREENEVWVQQRALQLFSYYRRRFYSYLWHLNAAHPGVVNLAAMIELEGLNRLLQDSPYPQDTASMCNPEVRDAMADYIAHLGYCDDSLQWTLFMPDYVQRQSKGFRVDSFAYHEKPAMRFIGREGEDLQDVSVRLELMQQLQAMTEYASGFDYDILLLHHDGQHFNQTIHPVWGRFMQAGTPVPDGLVAIDFATLDDSGEGPPYFANFAMATFSGDSEALHGCEGFDVNAMYDVTRNIILGDGVIIPYPEKYWTAEVFLEGCDKPSTAYLFSVVPKDVP